MDNAVALVQAFLRLHGYLTVTEFPVVRPDRHIACQSSFTFTVLIKRSKLPASFVMAAESLLDTT